MRWALALVLLLCRSKSTDTTHAAPTASVAVQAPASAPPSPPPPPVVRAAGDWGIAVRGEGKRAIVYFHGMYASPEDSCSYFEWAAKPRGTLICPRGPGGARFAESMAMAKAGETDGGVLMGFSIGAKTALDVALREKRWSGLFLMSMNLSLSAPALRAANVRGVVLAAGGGDGSFAQLKSQAAALAKSGYPARFVSLGDNVGHHFGPNMESIAEEALDWLDAVPE